VSGIEFDGDSLTVTIKYGKGYEETWAVFKGSSVARVRAMVIEYFGVDESAVSQLTAHELVVNVTNLAHGTGNAAAVLGAVVIPAPVTAEPAITGGNPWAGIEDEGQPLVTTMTPITPPEEKRNAWIYNLFAESTTIDELKRVYATHKTVLESDPDALAAWKARGKELSK